MKWLGRRLIEAALLMPLLAIGLTVLARDLWRRHWRRAPVNPPRT